MPPPYSDPDKEARYLQYKAKMEASREESSNKWITKLQEDGHMDQRGNFIKTWVCYLRDN